MSAREGVVAVIGSGSWGTAMAGLLAARCDEVALWCRDAAVAGAINATRRNPRHLVDYELPENVAATSDRACALDGAEVAVLAVPSSYLRGTCASLAGLVPGDVPLLVLTKGVEVGTNKLMLDVVADELGHRERIAVLSGPNHAEEVVRGIPSGTVIASPSRDTAEFFRDAFAAPSFRTYISRDVAGVELCAAFKNVIAIAVGLSYGLGFGDNTAAMLMTRGLAEMSRLVVKAGGQAITCMGLAGTGDLIATCTSEHSRNRRFGKMVAEGKTLDDFTQETHMVAEGALACKTIGTLAAHYGVELPITEAVRAVVWEGAEPKEIGRALADRPLTTEFYGI